MSIILVLIGMFVGSLSGFFGVGGGLILIPLLMTIGFGIKAAIGVSVVQMVFSSVYGSYLNWRKGLLQINDGLWVGAGGIIGGVVGARFTDILDHQTLKYIFLALVIFALLRIIFSKPYDPDQEESRFSVALLFAIGFGIGIIAMMLGVGGSVMLTPILVGYLHFSSKKAATAGLFFVVFSASSGLVYKLLAGSFSDLSLSLSTVLTVAVSALVGSWIGIWLKDKVPDRHHKIYMIVMYMVILALLIKRIWFT